MTPIRVVLIDLSGVLYVGEQAVPGAIAALQRLQESGLGVRFVTNTTRRTRADLVKMLNQLGFTIPVEQIMTAAAATQRFIDTHQLRPYLLIHPELWPEFANYREVVAPNAVVIGDAGSAFNYDNLNRAFQVLMTADNPVLVAMGDNRYFRDTDGLALDMGPFVAALEYASGIKATVTGKPAKAFFAAALDELGVAPDAAVMIGDDLESDVGGAQRVGLRGCLVRTGKYRDVDESHPTISPDHVADDFPAAVEWLLRANPPATSSSLNAS